MIQNEAILGNVMGVGTITGSITSAKCSNTGSMDPNVPWVCYSDVCFEDLPAALSHWRASMGPA